MKTNSIVAAAAIALVLSIGAFAGDEQAKGTHERIRAKVIQVFSVKQANTVFRAYLIKWNGHEVIASDQLAKSDHKVGDTITVLAMNRPSPNKKEGPRLLSFQVLEIHEPPVDELPVLVLPEVPLPRKLP